METHKTVEPEAVVQHVPGTQESVFEVIEAAKAFLGRLGVRSTLGASVVLRELLVNAVKHGNKNRPGACITCRIEHLGDFHFKIEVEDEGEGFDYERLNLALPADPRQAVQRGYLIINTLCDRLEFNEAGNRVTAYFSEKV